MNSSKARPSGRRNAWRLAHPPRRRAALCAAILACLGGSVGAGSARPPAHRQLSRSRYPHGHRTGAGGHRPADHHRPARTGSGHGAIERADVAGRLLSNVLVDARSARIRGARLRQRHPDRARCERALRRRRRLRDASHRPRQHRRRPTRTDLAALAAAVRASRRTSAVECIDRGRSAAEHAPHARPHPAYGSSRHAGSRGHRARERSGRRRGANARPAEPSGAGRRRRTADPGHRRCAYQQRAVGGLGHHPPADAGADRPSRHALRPGRRHVGALPELCRRRGSRDQAASAVRRRRRRRCRGAGRRRRCSGH